jgi:hypothetical protein
MRSGWQLAFAAFASSALLFAVSPTAEGDLFDDCSKGSQKACQEIERQAQRNKPALERLGRRAEAFRAQIQRLGLQSSGAPDLRKAYGLVLRDYLASDAVMLSHVQKMPEKKLVSACADQFHDFWIGQRKEWPKAQTGEPDWETIYMQILDHYFRFCRHQVR